MKCKNCGHLNKSNTYYCVKCGSSLDNSNPIRQYKQSAKNDTSTSNVFSKTQKFIIALVIIGILIVVLSAITPPDLELPSLAAPGNSTTQEPTEINEEIADKLNTTIQVGSVSAKTGEKVTVTAFVTDQNGNPVKRGTTSINLFDVKYSGEVENGNVNIVLPELSENNYETTIVYEGNDDYNPSETKVSIEVNKENTQIIAETKNNETIITLKSGNNEVIADAKLIITTMDGQTEQQTDEKGQVHIIPETTGKQEIKITFPGDDKYNPTETIIQIGKEKQETNLDTQYDEQEKTITITLTDKQKNPISDAQLDISINNQQTQQTTDSKGIVKIPVNTGENKILVTFPGNDTYMETQTTVNTVINSNTTNETEMENNQSTLNNTPEDDYVINDSQVNQTNTTMNETVNEKLTNTTIEVENDNNQTKITLLTDENQEISGENIKIILDNGTQLTEKTDNDGSFILNIDLKEINEIELIYEGNNEYNSSNKIIHINH